MSYRDRRRLKEITTLPSLVKYLREDLGWPVEQDSFEDLDDITFDWEADELGIDPDQAAKIEYIKQLRPLEHGEPQGVFFVKFDTRKLPVVALRRLLSKLVIKKRASAGAAERPLWAMRDLVFISSFGESAERQLSFAYFQEPEHNGELPSLKVLGWDAGDTPLHLDRVHDQLEAHLAWPESPKALPTWRKGWSAAFELRHGEVVTTAKQLAEQLATLARGIRERANQLLGLETETGPLRTLMEGFKKALIHDLTEDQFADMYAQTIAYGLLSARITNPDQGRDPVKAETLPDLIPVTNPFLKELMETFVLAGGKHRGRRKGHHLDFDELGINDVVELLRRANMDAVLRNFGADDRREDPVTYFYEDFLNAYDAQERKRRGVYYTPKPVVSYIVRSVHELLKTEFGIEDGLASTITWGEMAKRHKDVKIPAGTLSDSPFVQILDPATGTATFLVTVIEVIYDTLTEKWQKQKLSEAQRTAAWNEYVPKHLLPRLYGYELMMAPYAIAHLKIGLKLFETGYGFGSDERARVYLTNALEPASDASYSQIDALSNALAHEATAVNDVKRQQRPTVVVGNPPYAGHSLNNQVAWIVDKVYDYKRGYADLQKPGQAKWLQDDYVKFLRLAEWEIESSGTGVVGFITNHAWLENPTFKGMRSHLASTFNRLRVLDLHGNANKKDLAPDGSADENVFDIKQGVAISLLRRDGNYGKAEVSLVERGDLLGTADAKYKTLGAQPSNAIAFDQFRPREPECIFVSRDDTRGDEYSAFVAIPTLMDQNGDPAPGIVTTHDEFAVSFTRAEQIEKVEQLLATRTEEQARELFTLCSQNQWVYSEAKRQLRSGAWKDELVPILYRPFDRRWTVYNRYVAVHRRERVSRNMLNERNIALSVPRSTEIKRGWEHVFCSRQIIQHHTVSLKEVNYLFPLWLEPEWPETRRRANLSLRSIRAISEATGLVWAPDEESRGEAAGRARPGYHTMDATFGPFDVVAYVYAVLHSPKYRARYADFLKSDFARVPLTPTRGLLLKLGQLGSGLLAIHLLEAPQVNEIITTYAGPKNPEVARVGWSDDTVWLDAAVTKKGQPAEPGTIGFHGVPETVWNFHIGGYQVCEKWLKDRKGRKLLKADIEHYQKIVVAISETIRIMTEIDEVIEKHGGWPGAFKTGEVAGKKGQ